MTDGADRLRTGSALPDSLFQYRTVSVKHLQEMQDYIDRVRQEEVFSDNVVFRSYVDDKAFRLPRARREKEERAIGQGVTLFARKLLW